MTMRDQEKTNPSIFPAESLCQAAQTYSEKFGFSVIPVKQDKTPHVRWEEYQHRKATEQEIRNWWQRWPKANIAVVTGKLSGIFTVDADTPEAIQQAEEMIPDGTTVPVVNTPRGGRHYHFKYQDRIRDSNDGLLHIRGEGGYVIFPPSKRGDGRSYTWLAPIDRAGLPSAPPALIEYINNSSSLYRADDRKATLSSPSRQLSSTVVKMFVQGRRNDDLFHVANGLTRAGFPVTEISQVIEKLAFSCDPPFPPSEIQTTVESALRHAERREKALAEEVRDYVLSSSGVFLSSEVEKCLQVSSRGGKKNVSKILSRFCYEGFIVRVGSRNGCFRRVENQAEEIPLFNGETGKPLDLAWPFGLEELYQCLPKNVCIVAGSSDSGKTAFCLNFAGLNMDRFKVNYFSSEMGQMELESRLSKFEKISPERWKKVRWAALDKNYADVIEPDAVNVIDFLEIHDEFWKISGTIKEIFDKLRGGMALIALQKPRGRDVAKGGEATLEKPRLYLSMENNQVKIIKCKNWRDPERNPNGLSKGYMLVHGCKFIEESDWGILWHEKSGGRGR